MTGTMDTRNVNLGAPVAAADESLPLVRGVGDAERLAAVLDLATRHGKRGAPQVHTTMKLDAEIDKVLRGASAQHDVPMRKLVEAAITYCYGTVAGS